MISHKLAGFLILSLVSASVGVTAAGYTVHADRYEDRFIEGTFINGINAGNMSASEVEDVIRDRVEEYSLKVVFPDGSEELLTSGDLGFTYAPDSSVSDLLSEQDKYDWIMGKFGETSDYEVEEAWTYDPAKVEEAVLALPELQAENQIPPEDAYMKMGKKHRLEIVPETEGTEIKSDVVLAAVEEAVGNAEPEADLSDLDLYREADIKADDEGLNLQVNDINSYLDIAITYKLYDGSERVLNGDTMYEWISTREEDPDYYYLDTNVLQQKCREYVAALAADYDHTENSIVFHSTAGGDITFPVADFGHVIDQEAEAVSLYQDILGRQSVEKEPLYSLSDTFDSTFGGTYIEVDKTMQHAWYYQGGSLVWESDCVTGRESESGRRTPTGIYSIYMKQRNRTLKGQINPATGRPSYESFVNFWMPFCEGIGLHDATWRSSFGGDIYYYSGSHGCVNLPYGSAESLYNMVETGTPVIVLSH
ncbi:MAG: L,D-transpeptidase family protein [Lachnospiraceae bacterium]|nr:L,D-transpeptidase family protein [Lachnospiraceae bacterium]